MFFGWTNVNFFSKRRLEIIARSTLQGNFTVMCTPRIQFLARPLLCDERLFLAASQITATVISSSINLLVERRNKNFDKLKNQCAFQDIYGWRWQSFWSDLFENFQFGVFNFKIFNVKRFLAGYGMCKMSWNSVTARLQKKKKKKKKLGKYP